MIQVTLNANEFQWTGEYKGRTYTSLKVDYISNGRVYFTTIRDGIRWSTMAKQIKLENGEAYISFGKQGKLVIGTYVDDSANIEEVKEDEVETTPQETNEEVKEVTPENEVVNVESLQSNVNEGITKQTGFIDIPVYMRDFTEKAEYSYIINHKGLQGYIIKRSKSWWIVSHSKWVVMGSKTKKEAIDSFIKFVDERHNLLVEKGLISA